ncbi:hypothetical protein SAMN02745196_00066 [Clostridium collagenovorans DSM 3089]|uniref:Uncharacterized protein n=1 Tax=Clostridium collagenovorans DSM 3089 TaxID=1121306 RepID=A0A1M5S742_9CLOT|nr:hypothetical protein [Clostridium collagenovorans]SHH34417.1 hypothetical protein SAMN02745196_00066 [Clostridium collagenovorans DSM 3089]
MRIKKGINIILISIALLLLVSIGIKVYDNMNQKQISREIQNKAEEYRSKSMRFPVEIRGGEYKSIDLGYVNLLYEEDNNKKFEEVSKDIFIEECDTKYSSYVITKDTTYIGINIDGEIKFIEYPVTISDDSLKNLRNFMIEVNDQSIYVFPFNDGKHCLIGTDKEQYIFDIELGKVNWTRGNYYECPSVNIFDDTLECGGDLSANTYIFNKYGELIETINPHEDYVSLIAYVFKILLIIFIFIVLQRIVKFNVKSIGIRILVNVVIACIILGLLGLLGLGILFTFGL